MRDQEKVEIYKETEIRITLIEELRTRAASAVNRRRKT